MNVEPTAAAPLKQPGRLFIGGEWVAPSSDATIEVVTASTEQLFVRVAEAQEVDMRRAIAAARDAFDHGPWPRMSHAERAGYLRTIAEALGKRGETVGQIWTSESGVLNTIARRSATTQATNFKYYADLADTFEWEEQRTPRAGGKIGLVVREPVGVVGAIIPWNAPLAMIANKCAPALIAGCTIVLKASPEAPGAAYLIAEIAEEAGLPKGVLNVLVADRAVSELLVRSPDIDKITFTGSTATGRRIAALCGERIARYTLELGGKSAAVILDDFDVVQAARTIAGPALFLAGQVCSSLTRIIVPRSRHDAFVDSLSAVFAQVRVGDPFDPATQMGPLATGRQRERVEDYIARGIAEGATLAQGGKRPAALDRGFFIEPTVFGNVDNDATIAREEIFGPVLSVIPADSEAQAVSIANDTIYGLNASVFTNDADRAYAIARQLRSGTVGHNSFRTDSSMGFGGFKQSGIGREGGVEGLYSYIESKAVILEETPSHVAAPSGK